MFSMCKYTAWFDITGNNLNPFSGICEWFDSCLSLDVVLYYSCFVDFGVSGNNVFFVDNASSAPWFKIGYLLHIDMKQLLIFLFSDTDDNWPVGKIKTGTLWQKMPNLHQKIAHHNNVHHPYQRSLFGKQFLLCTVLFHTTFFKQNNCLLLSRTLFINVCLLCDPLQER